MDLACRFERFDALRALEDKALEDLQALGPNTKAHVFRGARGVPLPTER